MNTDPTARQPSISFVVPALNEEEHIEGAIGTILAAVQDAPISEFEIVMVDDGSTDRTREIMERLAAGDKRILAVHNDRNVGLGGAWKRGVAAARCDYVMMSCGDNIVAGSDIRTVLGHLGEADILLFHLANPKLRPLGRRIGSRGFTMVINLLFGLHLRYYQGLVPRLEHLRKITVKTDSHAFPAEVVVKLIAAGCSYVEFGVNGTPCRRDKSVALEPKRLLKVFQNIFDLVREVNRFKQTLRQDGDFKRSTKT